MSPSHPKTRNVIPKLSSTVLVMCIVFISINIIWIATLLFSVSYKSFPDVAPSLLFAGDQEVMYRSPYEAEFRPARSGQSLLTGYHVRTGEESIVELRLDQNIVRLGGMTDLEILDNRFASNENDRLVLKLSNGSVWVNAYDPIIIATPKARSRFAHSVGMVTYSDPMNRVLSVLGSIDLTLLDRSGKPLKDFLVPLKNQVTFADPQLIDEYSRLEYSKLRKELKLTPVHRDILDEVWVLRNVRTDASVHLAGLKYINSEGSYDLQRQILKIKQMLTFRSSQRNETVLQKADLLLRYLLGSVEANDALKDADALLTEFDDIRSGLGSDASFLSLILKQFYSIRNVPRESVAYKVKEHLRGIIFSEPARPEFLRSYFEDIDYHLRVNRLENVNELVADWSARWTDGMRQKYFSEYERQARLLFHLFLSYSDTLPLEYFALLHPIDESRIRYSSNSDDTLLEIANGRLEISKYLTAAQRFAEARDYLKTTFTDLRINTLDTHAAARKLYEQEVALLSERIDYAEKTVLASASDSGQFEDYLTKQERDEALARQYELLLESQQIPETVIEPPSLSQVAQRFTLGKMIVFEDDISSLPQNPFQFTIASGLLAERSSSGETLIFSGTYDYISDSIFNLSVNGRKLAGAFALSDFVLVARSSVELSGYGDTSAESTTESSDLSGFLNLTDKGQTTRTDLMASDLAIQLLIRELAGYNLFVNSPTQVEPLDGSLLKKFRISGVPVTDPVRNRRAVVNLDYDIGTRQVFRYNIPEKMIVSDTPIPVEGLVSAVFDLVYQDEDRIRYTREIKDEFNRYGLILEDSDFSFLTDDYSSIHFDSVRHQNIPVEVSGNYLHTGRVFQSMSNPLYTVETKTDPTEYLQELSARYILDLFAGKGIPLTRDNLTESVLAESIPIVKYTVKDQTYEFNFNVTSNRLTNVRVVGTDLKIDSMTFEDFINAVGKQVAPASSLPAPASGTAITPAPETGSPSSLTKREFFALIETCTEASLDYGFSGDVLFVISLVEPVLEDCKVHFLAIDNPIPTLVNTEMDCLIPMGVYDEDRFIQVFESSFSEVCQGSYSDALNNL